MTLIDMLKVARSLVVSNLQRFWPLFLVSSIGAIVFAYGSVVTNQAITEYGSWDILTGMSETWALDSLPLSLLVSKAHAWVDEESLGSTSTTEATSITDAFAQWFWPEYQRLLPYVTTAWVAWLILFVLLVAILSVVRYVSYGIWPVAVFNHELRYGTSEPMYAYSWSRLWQIAIQSLIVFWIVIWVFLLLFLIAAIFGWSTTNISNLVMLFSQNNPAWLQELLLLLSWLWIVLIIIAVALIVLSVRFTFGSMAVIDAHSAIDWRRASRELTANKRRLTFGNILGIAGILRALGTATNFIAALWFGLLIPTILLSIIAALATVFLGLLSQARLTVMYHRYKHSRQDTHIA